MNPLSPSASTFIPLLPASSDIDPIHAGVASRNNEHILKARIEGKRANVLDNERRSPIDRLDAMRDIDERSRSGLRLTLLQSLNPTAPMGYMKPEALHGSPWGVEILASGALKGGVTDAKGGSQSLNGQVFFSDRTPQRATDEITRENLRRKARLYSQGKGIVTASATSRAQQHRLTQILGQLLDSGSLPSGSSKIATIHISDPSATDKKEAAAWLQDFLHETYIVSGSARPLLSAPWEQSAKRLKLPSAITLKFASGSEQVLEGNELAIFYKQTADALRTTLESGKAPYLSLLNQGTIVPVVFGFEKIRNLASHSIHRGLDSPPELYSYQSQAHPLSGSAAGGRLKEIEVLSLADLATLCLGCAVKGTQWPDEVLVRIKGARQEKAEYLTHAQVNQFQYKVLAMAETSSPLQGSSALPLDERPLSELQKINIALRSENLRAYLQ